MTRTVFVDEKGMICLPCPLCGDRNMKPANLFPIHQTVSLTCSCGEEYEFRIETRKEFRKKTPPLKGYYVAQDSAGGRFEPMKVIDLSLHGCCLLASDKHTLHLGDAIKVIFKLEDAKRTEIKRNATVLRIMGNKIGCRLATDAYDPELGFYVEDFMVPKQRE